MKSQDLAAQLSRSTTCAVTVFALLVATASAQIYEIVGFTIDDGGGQSAAGAYSTFSAIGQPEGPAQSSGGAFTLVGGFIPTASGTPCPGDFDGDGDVDLSDLAVLLAAYDTCVGDPGYNPAADLNGSGCVQLDDLAALLAVYDQPCP